MKTKGKVLLVSLSAALLVSAGVAGSLAYFTDTDSATNTFSVGDVQITLDEADVNPDGILVPNAARVKENKYHLIPGAAYAKDPTVHVQAESEDCYVFVTVKNDIAEIEECKCETPHNEPTCQSIASQMKANGWTELEGVKDTYYYNGGLATDSYIAKNSNGVDLILFNGFKIDGDKVVGSGELDVNNKPPQGKYFLGDYATNADGTGTAVTVTAYAVQAAGFDTPEAAWTATFGK